MKTKREAVSSYVRESVLLTVMVVLSYAACIAVWLVVPAFAYAFAGTLSVWYLVHYSKRLWS